MDLDLADSDAVIACIEGVTVFFLKELLRWAALTAADESGAPAAGAEAGDAAPLRVTDAHLGAALDELLDIRNQLTRALLGAPGKGEKGGKAPRGRTP